LGNSMSIGRLRFACMPGPARRLLPKWPLFLACWALLCLAPPTARSASDQPPPANVETLLRLLGEPDVQKWLNERKPAANPAPAAQEAAEPRPATSLALERIRNHLIRVAAAAPRLPNEIAQAIDRLGRDVAGIGIVGAIGIGLLIASLGGLGLLFYRRLTEPLRRRLAASPVEISTERVTAVAKTSALDIGGPLAFAAAGVGSLLLLSAPPLLEDLLLVWVIATASFLLLAALLRCVLRPVTARAPDGARELRLLPLTDQAATFYYRRLTLALGVFGFGYALAVSFNLLGVVAEGRQSISYVLGLVLLFLMLTTVWRSPRDDGRVPPLAVEARRLKPWLLSVGMVLIWLLWAAGAMRLFWLIAVLLILPMSIRTTRRMVEHVMREPGTPEPGQRLRGVAAVCLDRGIRAILIAGAVLLLAWAWEIDLVDLTATDTFATRMLRGLMSAIVIVLIADFLWQLAKTLLDRQISIAQTMGEPGSPEARRGARLRTLLPIVRNVTLAVLAAVAGLMALASMGVEIGPLIAGAGVVGVAVGFGAQTVVKDVISGMFYLLDDAFRVGEYIESGKFKGTVESFSLRSVKLRHHRGPVFTVPFGELGAVQNMSRDWVIEKIVLSITYDSDVDKARKIIKKIGLELAEDPEFKDSTIDPLKMQGVENFGDYAIQIRLKLKTKPGEQFGIKRRAYMMIRQAFAENGIKFASPVVRVSGAGSEEMAAAAQQALAMSEKPST